MGAFALLIVALVCGLAVSRCFTLTSRAHFALDYWVLGVALPAIALADLHRAHLGVSLIWIIAVPWATFGFAALFYAGLKRAFGWSLGVFGALLITTGVGNTSLVGLPMIQVFFGAEWRATGIVIDQLGTYLILSTLGITIAALCGAGDRPTPLAIARRVLTFPPFIAVCLAFALHPVTFPSWLQTSLGDLGSTLAPVALFTVGTRLTFDIHAHVRAPLAAGLVAKLLLFPVLATVVLALTVGAHDTTARVAMFEMAMPPTIGGAIIATRYELGGALPSLVVGIGIVTAFATLPVWSVVLHHL